VTFKNITINMANPICQCVADEGKNLYSWGIAQFLDGPGLRVSCSKCNMELLVPHDKFRANFNIANPNKVASKPKAEKKQVERPKRKLPDYLRIVKE